MEATTTMTEFDASEYLGQVVRNHAAYEAAKDIHVCIAQLRNTRDPHRYRELHERLSTVLWPRYRCLQDWRYER